MADIKSFEEIDDPALLFNQFIEVWYNDKTAANLIGSRTVDLFGSGKSVDFLEQHYDRIFCNLNFTHVNLPKDKLSIGILCFPHYESFRPQEVIDGKKFSGSEEALIYMSLLLSGEETKYARNLGKRDPRSNGGVPEAIVVPPCVGRCHGVGRLDDTRSTSLDPRKQNHGYHPSGSLLARGGTGRIDQRARPPCISVYFAVVHHECENGKSVRRGTLVHSLE